MASFTGGSVPGIDTPYLNGWTNKTAPEPWTTESLLDPVADIVGGSMTPGTPVANPTEFAGLHVQMPEDDWFERLILRPGQINAGVVLSNATFEVEIFNSYRRAPKILTDFDNYVDDSVEIVNLPALPHTFQPLDSYVFDLRILAEGPPRIRGFLQFSFSLVDLPLLLAGQRGILIPNPPESPFKERLQFVTDVIELADGREKRVSLRAVPRQIFDLDMRLTDVPRQLLNNTLFGSQSSLVQVPVWYEATVLTAPAAEGDDTLLVEETDFRDFRADSLLVVYEDEQNYEVLEIESFTSTTITLKSTLFRSFTAGAQVMPVRKGYLAASARGSKEAINLQSTRIEFRVTDNSIDHSDTGGFSSFEGKVLLDDPNVINGTQQEALQRNLIELDNQTGILVVDSDWEVSRRTSSKIFLATSHQRLWEIRQLLHALRGRQVSFFIPTFFADLTPTAAVTSGAVVIQVANAGYTKFVRGRQPADVLRLLLKDGTSVVRRIVDSMDLGTTDEQITVSAPWGVDAAVEEIARVEIVEKARLDSDEISLVHIDALGNAQVEVPVKAVLE